jgi:hypothetical protein
MKTLEAWIELRDYLLTEEGRTPAPEGVLSRISTELQILKGNQDAGVYNLICDEYSIKYSQVFGRSNNEFGLSTYRARQMLVLACFRNQVNNKVNQLTKIKALLDQDNPGIEIDV